VWGLAGFLLKGPDGNEGREKETGGGSETGFRDKKQKEATRGRKHRRWLSQMRSSPGVAGGGGGGRGKFKTEP